MQKKRLLRVTLLLLRSFALYLTFGLFSIYSDFVLRFFNYDHYTRYSHLSITAIYVLGVIFPLLFYYSLIRTDAVHSNALCARFLAGWNRNDPPGLFQRFKQTICSPECLSDLAVHTLLLLILPSEFGFGSLAALLGASGGKGVLLLILIPTLTLLCVAARASALSAWTVQWSRKAGNPSPGKIPLWKMPVSVLIIWSIFSLTCAFSPLGFRSLYALFQILRLANPWILLPIVIGMVLLWYTVRLLVAAGKRFRFLRRLRKFCKENGYELLHVQKWIRTLFFPCTAANFSLQKGAVRYDCRLISSMGRHSPLLFREEGTVTCTHVLRLIALNLFHFDITYEYQFAGTGIKILILLPSPLEVLVSGYGVTQFAAPGSRVADCILYGAIDFLHAVERDVVGR